VVTADVSSGLYRAAVSKAGWYNVDRIYTVNYKTGVLKNGETIVSNALVVLYGSNFNSYTSTYTDSQGNYRIPYKAEADSTFWLSYTLLSGGGATTTLNI
jgi:hypothetical protein